MSAATDEFLGKNKPITFEGIRAVMDAHIAAKRDKAAAEAAALERRRALIRANAQGGREAPDIAAMRVLLEKQARRARGELIGLASKLKKGGGGGGGGGKK